MPEEPYGANQTMRDWASKNSLKYRPRAHCLHWLNKGRCGVVLCEFAGGSERLRWMDHVSGWTDKNGHRLLLCQPYDLYDRSLHTLHEACETFHLSCNVTSKGWYGHGTVCIELMPAEQPEMRLWSPRGIYENAGRIACKKGQPRIAPTKIEDDAIGWWFYGWDRQQRGAYGDVEMESDQAVHGHVS